MKPDPHRYDPEDYARMTEVNRFSPKLRQLGYLRPDVTMVPDPDGLYVPYHEHLHLVAKLAEERDRAVKGVLNKERIQAHAMVRLMRSGQKRPLKGPR